MYNVNLARLTEIRTVFVDPGFTPDRDFHVQYVFTFQCTFYQAKPIVLENTLTQNYYIAVFRLFHAHGAGRTRTLRLKRRMWEPLCYVVLNTLETLF